MSKLYCNSQWSHQVYVRIFVELIYSDNLFGCYFQEIRVKTLLLSLLGEPVVTTWTGRLANISLTQRMTFNLAVMTRLLVQVTSASRAAEVIFGAWPGVKATLLPLTMGLSSSSSSGGSMLAFSMLLTDLLRFLLPLEVGLAPGSSWSVTLSSRALGSAGGFGVP